MTGARLRVGFMLVFALRAISGAPAEPNEQVTALTPQDISMVHAQLLHGRPKTCAPSRRFEQRGRLDRPGQNSGRFASPRTCSWRHSPPCS